ncbi:lipid-A-disaccharide synthase [Xenococcus sp. PCC 7305]|uniref:lipid-A-disaccharide synthase n=1 Tax=Xenococcus sp. PCC 7305 TaxID=102125 RepID=UPI0002AC4A4A|nr:lipid-A-disaccharide synthase [Xenococcus sp. PCC 7305]ELS05152.1 lipid-A-disaccharide synthase [Xenococcus sp. PCC 7305]
MRIFISTGEVSGDLQGAMLVEALHRQAKMANLEVEIVALGGDRMKEAGANVIVNTTTIGSIGFFEALPLVIPTIKVQNQAKKYLQEYPPDVLVLIDYAAPNIAIASYVKKNFPQIPVVYYIAPQDWAVPRLGNASKVIKIADRILAIFPEEAKYYRSKGVEVTWVGHPLIDRINSTATREQARLALDISLEQNIITLLPASRKQEITQMLPTICEAAQLIQQKIPDIQFLIPISLRNYREAIAAAITEYNLHATIIEEKTLDAIAAADIAITKSGTVNLEIALLNTPQIVFYRVHPITAWVGRNILKIKIIFMSPPNLILNRGVVPELQQEAATPENIAETALELFFNQSQREKIIAGYQEMRELLGELGVCDRAAQEIFKIAQKHNNSKLSNF